MNIILIDTQRIEPIVRSLEEIMEIILVPTLWFFSELCSYELVTLIADADYHLQLLSLVVFLFFSS